MRPFLGVLCKLTPPSRRAKTSVAAAALVESQPNLALGRPSLAFLKLEEKHVGCLLESRF
jgi:hypothetical protein